MSRPKKVLAISSRGGHWVELRRLRPAFETCDVTWCTTSPDYRSEIGLGDGGFRTVPEANRWQKLRLLAQIVAVFWTLLRVRPDVVISTGAAPGFFAVLIGRRLFRARTIWVQSLADTEGMSMSGGLAGRHADLWLTQWEHLARPEGPHYRGAIL